VRIRSIRPFVAFLLVSIVCVGGVLTGCGSSSSPATQTTSTTTNSGSTGSTQNAVGCAAGTSIPQGGGDNDGDNSGGSSDGDGCL
jgi:hypothetical protein